VRTSVLVEFLLEEYTRLEGEGLAGLGVEAVQSLAGLIGNADIIKVGQEVGNNQLKVVAVWDRGEKGTTDYCCQLASSMPDKK